MSLTKLINIIETATESTLIKDVYFTHRYDKLEDNEKSQNPFLLCDVTGAEPLFTDASVFFDTWTVNTKIFLGDANNKSKGQLSKEELINIEEELDSIRTQLIYNIRENEEVNDYNVTVQTNFPMYNNGAVVWVLPFSIQLLNDNKYCNENC